MKRKRDDQREDKLTHESRKKLHRAAKKAKASQDWDASDDDDDASPPAKKKAKGGAAGGGAKKGTKKNSYDSSGDEDTPMVDLGSY